MAKKGPRKDGFNMSEAVRDVLRDNAKLSAREVEAEVKKKHPGQKLNSGSLSVAFTNARQQLGIAKKRKSVKRRKPTATATARPAKKVDMSALQAAQKFVSEVGNIDQAIDAVKQLKTLQIK